MKKRERKGGKEIEEKKSYRSHFKAPLYTCFTLKKGQQRHSFKDIKDDRF
jgi:hypothetical protein